MNELKVGDVVYLNSESSIYITITYIDKSDDTLQGVYFNIDSKKFEYTPELPLAAVTKVG